jgi:acetyl esterase/lipase
LPAFSCLQVKIAKALALREQAQRKRNLTKYIPNAAGAIFTVLAAMAGSNPKGPKRRRLQEASNLLHQVARKEVGVVDWVSPEFWEACLRCMFFMRGGAWQPAAVGGTQGDGASPCSA